MMATNDRSYLERRAEQELRLAQKAKDARAVSDHYKLACRYLDLLYPEDGGKREADAAHDQASARSGASTPSTH